ncbi:uncharacterized protein LOC124140776 [Haliotis rufescens]|uniref:uncharacterized protein LOC124140776 n=1 Tax=Haliotis rufescens TaxID=6454 RepID=UPI00201F0740|nr:uncharacterized protein LOC124140776 [Haliotis rufescens]
MAEDPAGEMRMCRGGVIPWYRRKTCLIWTLLIAGAVAYLVYTRRRHIAFTQSLMEHIPQLGGGGGGSNVAEKEGGFWESHGGEELKVGHGKVRVRQPVREPVHFGQDREPHVNDVEEVKVEHNIAIHKPVVKVDEVIDIDGPDGDVQNDNQDVKEPADTGHIPGVKDEQNNIEVKVENKVPEVKDEVEDVNNNIEFAKDKEPVQNKEPAMQKHEVAKILGADKERLAALKRKLEFAQKEANNVAPPGRAGVVDAVLPDRATLSTWDHGRLESTFHNYVIVPQIECAIIAPMGKKGDGAWDVCHADGYRPERPCLMYSFGFDTNFKFEDDVAKRYGCETHYFDPKMKSMDGLKRMSGVVIHALTLSSDNGRTPSGWKVRTLATVKDELFHTKAIDILKVDIEDNEWRAIPEMFESGVMGKVKQFLLEIHVLSQSRTEPSKEDYINYLVLMRDIYIDGFRIARTSPHDKKIKSMFGEQRPQSYDIMFLRIREQARS